MGARQHYTPTLYRLKGATRPLPLVEDIAVPPEALPEFLPRAQQIFREEQTTASLFGHVGHGQLHFRPFLDLANSEDIAKMDVLAEKLYEEAWRVGGTISGEHGDGLSRTPFVARQYGDLMPAFREVKQLFDPENLFNPGKILTSEETTPVKQLRHVSYPLLESTAPGTGSRSRSALPRLDLQLAWKPEEMAQTARSAMAVRLAELCLWNADVSDLQVRPTATSLSTCKSGPGSGDSYRQSSRQHPPGGSI